LMLPLPLGEGWGEGLAATQKHINLSALVWTEGRKNKAGEFCVAAKPSP